VIRFFARICPLLSFVGWLVVAPGFATDAELSKIESREPRARIRAELLRETKIGSTAADVLRFVTKNFIPKDATTQPQILNHPAVGPTAKESEKRGVQSIRIVLGDYISRPALLLLDVPVISKTTTAVQWAFSKDGKLIEIFVDKDTEIGDRKGPDDQ